MASPLQIRAARILLGWSQKTLAGKANISCNTVGRIESGYRPPGTSG
jgi:transcriptional regulator with XRE-family HTH domain